MNCLTSLFLLVMIALTVPVLAQQKSTSGSMVEEILVTAEFRNVSLMKSPASVSVVSLHDDKSGTLNHLEEILGRMPNVNLASGASRARFVQVRGIGERSQFSEPLNSSVGLILDGVDMSGVGTAATLFDVSQVEVLRGPQGTLYGANALAGLINVTSNDPTQNFAARLNMDVGDYSAWGIGGAVSGPITEVLGFRLAVHGYRDDGFIDNNYLIRDDTNNHDELTIRGKLLWTPDDASEWLLTVGVVDVDNGYDAFSLDNDRNTLSDQPGKDIQKSTYASLKLIRDFTNGVVFEGSLGVADSKIDYGYDEDWTYPGFHAFGYSSTDRYLRDRTTQTFEARLLSGDGPRIFSESTQWVAGVYLLNQDTDLTRRYTFLSQEFESAFEVDRQAVYAELTTSFSPGLRLTLGVRAERHRADYRDSSGVRRDPTDSMFGGRVVLEWDLANDALFYASATRGYKAGGFNTSGTLDADLRDFRPETLWNFEAGLKGLWMDDRLSTRLAIFSMLRDDMQVTTSIERVIPGSNAVEFIAFIGNAAQGGNSGLELELHFNVNAKLDLFANLGLLHTEFDDYTNGSGDNLDGRDQAHAPAYQFYLGGEYTFAPRWFVRVELEGKDGYFFSDGHGLESDEYELVNLSLGYAGDGWQAKLWSRNLLNEDYLVRGFFFGNDPRDGYTARGFTQFGEPRRYGVSLSFEL